MPNIPALTKTVAYRDFYADRLIAGETVEVPIKLESMANKLDSFTTDVNGVTEDMNAVIEALNATDWDSKSGRVSLKLLGLALDGSDEKTAFLAAVATGVPLLVEGGTLGLSRVVVPGDNIDIEIARSATIKALQPQLTALDHNSEIRFSGKATRFHCFGTVDGNDTGRTTLEFDGDRSDVHIDRITNVSIVGTSSSSTSGVVINGSDTKVSVKSDGFVRHVQPSGALNTAPRTLSVHSSAQRVHIESLVGGEGGGTFLMLAEGSSGRADYVDALNVRDNGIYALEGSDWNIGTARFSGIVPEPIVAVKCSLSIDKVILSNCTSIGTLAFDSVNRLTVDKIEYQGDSHATYLIQTRTSNTTSRLVRIGEIVGEGSFAQPCRLNSGAVIQFVIGKMDLDLIYDNALTDWEGNAINYIYSQLTDFSAIDSLALGDINFRVISQEQTVPNQQIIRFKLTGTKPAIIDGWRVTIHDRNASGVRTSASDFYFRGENFFRSNVEINCPTLTIQVLTGSDVFAREDNITTVVGKWVASSDVQTAGPTSYFREGLKVNVASIGTYHCIESGSPGTWRRYAPRLTGTTAERPTIAIIYQEYDDTTLGATVYWNGHRWVLGDGVHTSILSGRTILSAGQATVTDSLLKTSSRVILTRTTAQAGSGAAATYQAVTADGSFTISAMDSNNSLQTLDTTMISWVAYQI